MSKINDLIKEMCPNGVPFKEIGDICETITDYVAAGSFKDLANNVKYLQKPDYAMLIRTTDIKNKFKGDKFIYINESAFNYLWRVNLDKDSLIFPNIGNCGEIYYLTPDDLPYKRCALATNAILVRSEKINMKYLKYAFLANDFQIQLKKITSPSGQTKFNKTDLKKLLVPVPPIEIQEEIVRILDKFGELEAELEARKSQYEFWRDKILKQKGNIEISNLFRRVKGTPITAGKMKEIESHDGKIRIFAGGKTAVNANIEDIPKANIIDYPCVIVQSRGVIDFIYYDKPFTFKNEMWAYTCDNQITVKYLYYYLKNNVNYFRKIGTQMGSMPQISLPVTENFEVYLPTLEEQKKIVNILDVFDKLVNDISEGIPAEIELRKKQYEYYRNKLLNFEELKNE